MVLVTVDLDSEEAVSTLAATEVSDLAEVAGAAEEVAL